MIALTIHHDKDGTLELSSLGEQSITDENLDFVLFELVSNFGFDVVKTEKDGKELSDTEVNTILATYPCNNNLQEWQTLFFPHSQNQ